MKGWRPPLQSQEFETGSGFFFAADGILPDIGSIGLSLLPVLGLLVLWTGFPFSPE